jgi:hypothetical protein
MEKAVMRWLLSMFWKDSIIQEWVNMGQKDHPGSFDKEQKWYLLQCIL